MSKKKSALLVGSFSGGNYGDSLILIALLEFLQKNGFTHVIIPVSTSIDFICKYVKKEFTNNSLKIDFIDINMKRTYGYRFFNRNIIKVLKDIDYIFFTAGTVFFRDILDPRKNFIFSIYILLSLFGKKNIKLAGLFVGINEDLKKLPFLKKIIARSFFKKFDFMICRDEYSYINLKNSVYVNNLTRSYDIGFYKLLSQQLPRVPKENNNIGINICEYLGNQVGERVNINILARFIESISYQYDKILFFHTTVRDENFVKRVFFPLVSDKFISKSEHISLFKEPEYEKKYEDITYFIGMRMHSLIPAIAMKIPTNAFNYNDKVISLYTDLGGAASVIKFNQIQEVLVNDIINIPSFLINEVKKDEIICSVKKINF